MTSFRSALRKATQSGQRYFLLPMGTSRLPPSVYLPSPALRAIEAFPGIFGRLAVMPASLPWAELHGIPSSAVAAKVPVTPEILTPWCLFDWPLPIRIVVWHFGHLRIDLSQTHLPQPLQWFPRRYFGWPLVERLILCPQCFLLS